MSSLTQVLSLIDVLLVTPCRIFLCEYWFLNRLNFKGLMAFNVIICNLQASEKVTTHTVCDVVIVVVTVV